MNAFHRYLVAWRAIHDDQSDAFVEMAVGDAGLPDPQSWDELSDYLLGQGADAERVICAQAAYERYDQLKRAMLRRRAH